jgi:hypothetical protein
MPVKQKTTEEYKAMAMLLGYHYSITFHVFDALPLSSEHKWLDPDTLEVLCDDRKYADGLLNKRRNQWQEKELAPCRKD